MRTREFIKNGSTFGQPPAVALEDAHQPRAAVLDRLQVAVAQLLDHVRDSDVVLLFQSKEVLQRPWCLLELVTAIDAGIPIVGVALSSGPYAYDFRAAAEFLLALGEPGLLDHDAAVLLEGQGVSLVSRGQVVGRGAVSVHLRPPAPAAVGREVE